MACLPTVVLLWDGTGDMTAVVALTREACLVSAVSGCGHAPSMLLNGSMSGRLPNGTNALVVSLCVYVYVYSECCENI